MANYVKQTWTDGVSALSAARMGVIEQGVFDAHFQPAARVTHSTTQSITSGTPVALAFNTERFDNDVIHDTVTNNTRLTCKTAGYYQISGSAEWAANATGQRDLQIRVAGTTVIGLDRQFPGVATAFGHTVTSLWSMAVNDYVELWVNQTSGGALLVNQNSSYTPEFMMVRVG